MGSAVGRHWCLWLLMAVFVLVQFTYILKAATQTTAFYGPSLILSSCAGSAKGGKPIGSTRDCTGGQGSECTYDQPCTPCSLGGCQPCAGTLSAFSAGSAKTGECFFVEGVGPYCQAPGSSVVVPCTQCCS